MFKQRKLISKTYFLVDKLNADLSRARHEDIKVKK